LNQQTTHHCKGALKEVFRIIILIALTGCGQKAGLTLPTDVDNKSRAYLPQIFLPIGSNIQTPNPNPNPIPIPNPNPNVITQPATKNEQDQKQAPAQPPTTSVSPAIGSTLKNN
jgi:predicted small lipoprotein YifL